MALFSWFLAYLLAPHPIPIPTPIPFGFLSLFYYSYPMLGFQHLVSLLNQNQNNMHTCSSPVTCRLLYCIATSL